MALQDNLTNRGGQDWDLALRNALDQADQLIAQKANADHTHGSGGPVMDIGTSLNRPALRDGFVHSETDSDQLAVLNADASLRYRLVSADQAALNAMILGG